MKWTDVEDIALALHAQFPTQNPLAVRFTDLRAWVLALPGFDDDPAASNESRLEAIQMAWHEEVVSSE
jgi:FeS assembly protein IscX